MKKRIVFMGSPAFAVPSLRALDKAGFEIVAVYTQPPRPAGRGQQEHKTRVHEAAEELGLGGRMWHPEKLRGADLDAVLAHEADVFAVVAYGLILPKALVESRICVNVHPSALPKWRGAAPIQHSIMAGDAETEVCVMRLEAGMDTGPVYDRVPVGIPEEMTSGELLDMCAQIGAERLVEVVGKIEKLTPVAQAGQATYADKITPEMTAIEWKWDARRVHDLVRGLAPSPRAKAEIGGETVKVVRAHVTDGKGRPGEILHINGAGMVVACGSGAVRILELQRAGKRAMPADEVARGWPELAVGKTFKV